MKKVLFRRGFTLIELVLVVAILAVIGLALYGTFANGIQIWKNVTQNTVTEDIHLFFDRISTDLRNTFVLKEIKFRGSRDKVSLPAKVAFHDEDGVKSSIGKVTYLYNRQKQRIERTEENYSEVYRNKPGPKRTLAEQVSSLQFDYYVYDEKKKTYYWDQSWQEHDDPFGVEQKDNLPLIVRIKVGTPDEHGERLFVKTLAIPSACCWPVLEESE